MKTRLFLFVVVTVVMQPVAVTAGDHRAPRATLHVGNLAQDGRLHHADGWAERSEEPRFCDVSFATGFRKFGKPLRHTPGQEIIVRLHKKAPPVEVEVLRWPRVDEKGRPAGSPTPLPWLLRPWLVQGSIQGWEVVVLPPIVNGHLYLDVGAYWRDEDGCYQEPDLGNQYAAWTFHLRGS